MAKSIIEPLLKDHAHLRTLAGELRAHTERFDIPGMRHAAQQMVDTIQPHVLKEESVLYLIGMKYLKADNKVLPGLFKEHDQTLGRLHRLTTMLFSARLTNIEEQARQMVFVILEALDHHFQEEESKVFPALDKLIDDQTKELVLKRYSVMDGSDFDELDRMPLLSLPDSGIENTDSGMANIDNIGQTQFGLGTIG
jgi:hemerythrin-like domain-containing protein